LTIADYIDSVNKRFKTGISREHSYRGDLQNLLESLAKDVLVTNEPARVECGAPDYILTKKNIPVGYIEAKDIGSDLHSKAYREQFDRYRKSLGNLIITDYLEFQLFREGESVTSVAIGQIRKNRTTGKNEIMGLSENYAKFADLIKAFCTYAGQTVKSASELSKMMAAKARLMAGVIEKALHPAGEENKTDEQNSTLHDQFKSFQQILIHDITEKEFADIYAQTIAYGMFAARLHNQTTDSFSRREAAELIPKSNPFLRKFFQYIAGYDLDERVKWIVDALADVFRAADIAELLKDFGKAAQKNDPVIHFYETFLSEYDLALRKSRGVWYTPEPVVNFIVRAVDDILKSDFGLTQGLADTSKTKIKADVQGKKIEQEVHKVQILDPAAGTGTFLAEVVKHIHRQFEEQQGIWSSYVEEHLIPRLNGFEILMASYAMAHLKLDLLLTETGYKAKKEQRFRVFLTNSLEEHHPDTGSLFAAWLSTEANEANYIKRDTPVMVVLGNPPYSVSSSNKSKWIETLMVDYKKDLNERNIQPLSDDYIKFIRFGQHFIDKNGSGILAYISNNSFIDGLIHRQMRKHLLENFDKIYILDLHGNSKKKETAPDGGKDENIFDIMQGVSINIFVKNGKRKTDKLSKVFHYNLYGKRDDKYTFLNENNISNMNWNQPQVKEPNFFFTEKDLRGESSYNAGVSIKELFAAYGSGIKFRKDNLLIKKHFTRESVRNMLADMQKLTKEDMLKKYDFKETQDWMFDQQRSHFLEYNDSDIKKVCYRPFDNRYTFYPADRISKIIPRGDARKELMLHFLRGENLSLLSCRQQSAFDFQHVFVSKLLTDMCAVSSQTKETAYVFPLYLYPDRNELQSMTDEQQRKTNLHQETVCQIADKMGLQFTNESFGSAQDRKDTFAPIDILDYIYAVLHSPLYRQKYKEFLKIDFPKVPYPKDSKTFWQLVKFGGELRQIHLLESPILEKQITAYPQPGENRIEKIRFENSRVWINKEQYFDKVPQIAWEFYIGGYQPAQKWLKDRKGRKLNFDDIVHYQKIISALSETDRIMKQIDKTDFF